MRGARKGPAISPSPGRSGDPHRLRRHGRITIRPGYAAGARDADGGVIGSRLRLTCRARRRDTRPERPVDVHQCACASSILESDPVAAENGRRPMIRNCGTPDHSGQAIERGVERAKDFLAAEMRATHRRAEDRAHIATTGDRPFAGSNPCRASKPVASMTPRCNPAARRGTDHNQRK